MKNILVSFSGGRTSAYMARKMQLAPEFANANLAYVFANTGKEREEILDFIRECDERWGLGVVWIESVITQEMGVGVGYKVVDFETASRNGEPFSDMVRKFGIPNKEFPHCTRELKERPLRKFARAIFGDDFVSAIGFRADETTRASADPAKIYPLIQMWPTNERMVRDWWKSQPFDLRLKDYEGNCDLCWKKSLLKRLTLISEGGPNVWRQWAEWEATDEYVFDRDGFTLLELVEMSSRPFKRAIDKDKVRELMPELFDIDMFAESKCHCA